MIFFPRIASAVSHIKAWLARRLARKYPMPGERSPRRGGWASNGASPSSRRQVQPPEPQRRWGSNLSTQRRERTTVWASCLHTVQSLRQGGSWRATDTSNDSARQHIKIDGGDGGGGACVSRQRENDVRGGGNGAKAVERPAGAEADLHAQLDVLAALSYPNSSIRCVYVCTVCLFFLACID